LNRNQYQPHRCNVLAFSVHSKAKSGRCSGAGIAHGGREINSRKTEYDMQATRKCMQAYLSADGLIISHPIIFFTVIAEGTSNLAKHRELIVTVSTAGVI
jgi:hypothetical protein